MRITVCAKHVVDSTEVRFDETTQQVELRNLPTKISDYDRNAVEAAVVLKERLPDATVDVIMVGDQRAQKTLKEALAMGADAGYLVEEGWENAFDPLLTARVLTRAIQELGDPDLVFCGLVSEDGYNGLTAAALAEMLGYPYLAPVVRLEATDETVEATIDRGDSLLTVRTPHPCVLAIDSSMNLPRLPTVLQVMKVKSDRLHAVALSSLSLDREELTQDASRVSLAETASGAVRRRGEILDGAVGEAVLELVGKLSGDGVLP